MSYREKTAALMISLRFNVGYIRYGCCPGPGKTQGRNFCIGASLLERPTETCKVSRVLPEITDVFFLCVQYLINILLLRNQRRVTFGAILGCTKEKFGFVMAVTGLLRPASHALFVISSIPTLQMIDEHVMGSSVAQHEGELQNSASMQKLKIHALFGQKEQPSFFSAFLKYFFFTITT